MFLRLSLQDISIEASPTSQTVRENDGDVEICFKIIEGSIEADTDIEVKGNTRTRDGEAEGTLVHLWFHLYATIHVLMNLVQAHAY